MSTLGRELVGSFIVATSMVAMFILPKSYFVSMSLISTTMMLLVAIWLTHYSSLFSTTLKTVSIGIVSAFLLYLVFLGGNAAITTYAPLGVGVSNENTIYSLFASTPIWLKVVVFLLDAIGFESFFRGTLQKRLILRTGISSVFIVALIDALIHVSSLNPLFSVTTFIADSVWGLNFYYTKDLYSNFASHFLWDMLVFVLAPIS